MNGNLEGIFGARVPLLKFKEAKSGIECDICINNTAGVPNSKLTRLYCEFDQRVHIMVKYLRILLKKAGLLFGDQGCLSSYSIILMVIAFLQNQEDPVLPNLQNKPGSQGEVFYYVSKNRFGRVHCKEVKANLNEDFEKLKKEFDCKNTKGVAQLVIEFLEYYFLNPTTAKPQIDVSKGGYVDTETDEYSLFDIVEPFNETARVGQGCRKDSHHPDSYTKFAFDFLSNVVGSSSQK